jgi:hypothetical protein
MNGMLGSRLRVPLLERLADGRPAGLLILTRHRGDDVGVLVLHVPGKDDHAQGQDIVRRLIVEGLVQLLQRLVGPSEDHQDVPVSTPRHPIVGVEFERPLVLALRGGLDGHRRTAYVL